MNYKKVLFVSIIGIIFTFNTFDVSKAQNIKKLPDIIPPTSSAKKQYRTPNIPLQSLGSAINDKTIQSFLLSQKDSKDNSGSQGPKLSRIEQIFNNIYIKRLQGLDTNLNIDYYNLEDLKNQDSMKAMDLESLLKDKSSLDMSQLKDLSQQKDMKSMNSLDIEDMSNVNVTGIKIPPKEKALLNDDYIDPDKILYQYGYDIFKERVINTAVEGDSRLLSPGDTLMLNLSGDAIDILMSGDSNFKPTMVLTVDKDGNITIPGTGNLFVAGLSLDRAKTGIKALFSQRYVGVDVDLKLEQAGATAVYVLGEVESPGLKMIPASGTVIDALSLAGGIKKTGSLRNIILTNKTKSKKSSIDLYEFIRNGVTYSKALERGSVIIVPPIGNVVALNGAILNPAIYEFKKDESLQSLLEIAGGFLPSVNKNFVLVESFNVNDNNKMMSELNGSTIKFVKLKSGDLITFYESSEEINNGISLLGNIKNPRNIQIKDNTVLSDILKSKDDLLPRTNEDIVEIERETGIGKNPKVFNLSLKQVIEGNTDIKLEPRDKVRIFNDVITPEVRVSGSVKTPGIFPVEPDMKITDIIGKVGLLYPSEEMVVELTRSDGTIETVYLYDLLTLNDSYRNSSVKAGDSIYIRKLKDGERLKTVTMLGFVGKPGVYKLDEGMKFIDALSTAGGLRDKAYLKGLIFIRRSILKDESQILEKLIKRVEGDALQSSMKLAASGDTKDTQALKAVFAAQKNLAENLRSRSSELYGRLVLDPNKNFVETLNHIDMRDGDIIYIPEKTDYILVTGEVYNQSALLFDDNKSVKQYINDVGGFTKKAAKNQAYISKVNGTIIAYRQNKGKFLSAKLDPGDAIVIPSKTNPPINVMSLVKDMTDIIAKSATTVYMLTNLK